ncbi:putative deoxyribonuclease TATDN2 [Caerostris extrusa]|uniref:Deoxyribonuclease TATDN2 n=1 Tax=Caerostris extrusa TaxID=172846 RepID=A0AAV4XPU9_CAEEX|nr:putative deoxyribonuclease TATDN2 [Caerostris extrusa]
MDTCHISSADEYRLPLFSNNDSSWLFSEKSGSDESKPLVLTEDYVSHLYSSGDSLDISNVQKADVNSPSIVAEQSPSSDTDSNSSDKYHTSGYVSSQSDLDSSGLLMPPKDKKCVLKNHISMLKSSTPKNEICSPELRDSGFEVDNNNELSSGINHGRKSLSKIVRNLDCESCEKTEKLYMNAERFQKNRKKTLPDYDASALYTMKSATGFYDSHCHLDFLFTRTNYYGTFADYQVENKDTFPNIYRGCIFAVFCKPWTFAKRHIWQKHLSQNNIWGAFGCHPHEAAHYDDSIENDLKLALTHPKVKALGEIGLDYSSRNNCSKEIQHTVFKRQLEIARNSKLPLVIHCRDANQDCINILKTFIQKDTVFHLHCFTDSWAWAEKWMEAFPNVHIGITNLVTFESAKDTHEVARKIPLNRLLLETDTPYFIPRKSPFGTKYSHPGMAIHVAAQIAALRGIEVDEVIQSTCRNTKFVYNLP